MMLQIELPTMKTMLELLIRLHEMRCCCDRAKRNSQLTPMEKATVRAYKQLVRECLPAEALAHYDRMKKSERSLRTYPEVFAMAVLVATFRSLTPSGRRKLVAYFAPPSPVQVTRIGTAEHKHHRAAQRYGVPSLSRFIGEPWPR